MLQVDHLVKDYRHHRAVNDVSFYIPPGQIVGLLGPNGAGKTTCLRCIAGILKPNGGQALINGADIELDPVNAKRGMSFVPELPQLYELLTVQEHLRFVAMCFNTLDEYDRNGDALLARYHLTEKKKELVATLSKGMRQKLAIACAMVHRANVLLFDEPIIGVDPAGVAEIKADMHAAKAAGCSVLVSTHLLDTAEKLCDRVIIMAKGHKVAEGTFDELKQITNMPNASLEEVFLYLTEEVPASAP